MVAAFTGWQSHAVAEGADLSPVDLSLAPPAAFLGVLGMPGFTEISGLEKIGRPVEGQTLVVAAASWTGRRHRGPDGQATWLDRRGDCSRPRRDPSRGVRPRHGSRPRVPGLRAAAGTGHASRRRHLLRDVWRPRRGCGVPTHEHPRRAPLCGMIADYNGQTATTGSDRLPALYRHILNKSLSVRGFLSREFEDDLHDTFLADMGSWVRQVDRPPRGRDGGARERPSDIHRVAARRKCRQGGGAGCERSGSILATLTSVRIRNSQFPSRTRSTMSAYLYAAVRTAFRTPRRRIRRLST